MAYKIWLYPERWDTLKNLSFEDKGKILECIFEYDRIRSIPFDWHIAVIFWFLKNRIDHDKEEYEAKCKKNKEISDEYWKKKKNRTDTEWIPKDNQTTSNSNSNSNSNIISKDIINIYKEFKNKSYLTIQQVDKLKSEYWNNVIDNYIEDVENYIVNNPKGKYVKDVNLTIRNWLRKNWVKKKPQEDKKEVAETDDFFNSLQKEIWLE